MSGQEASSAKNLLALNQTTQSKGLSGADSALARPLSIPASTENCQSSTLSLAPPPGLHDGESSSHPKGGTSGWRSQDARPSTCGSPDVPLTRQQMGATDAMSTRQWESRVDPVMIETINPHNERGTYLGNTADTSENSCNPEEGWRDPYNASRYTAATRRDWLARHRHLTRAWIYYSQGKQDTQGALVRTYGRAESETAEGQPSIPGCEGCFACHASFEIGSAFVKLPVTRDTRVSHGEGGEQYVKEEDIMICTECSRRPEVIQGYGDISE